MTITDRSDGSVALDFERVGVPGPFIVLSKSQLAELERAYYGRWTYFYGDDAPPSEPVPPRIVMWYFRVRNRFPRRGFGKRVSPRGIW